MKIIPFALIAVATVGFSSAASAERSRCPTIPEQQWMAVDKAVEKAESLGYSIRQAKRSKNCWKIEGYDRNGAEIEIHIDPASGNVVKPRGWHPPAGG